MYIVLGFFGGSFFVVWFWHSGISGVIFFVVVVGLWGFFLTGNCSEGTYSY